MNERSTPVAEDRYEAFRRKIARSLASICPAWLRNRRDDIVQVALIRLMDCERKSEGNPEFNASYLWRVAYSAMVDEIRRVRRLQETSLEDRLCDLPGQNGSMDPEEHLRSREIGLGIQDCLTRLVDSRRTAVALFLQGHSVPEAARLVGWNSKKTENLVYRGLADLRACLTRKGLNP